MRDQAWLLICIFATGACGGTDDAASGSGGGSAATGGGASGAGGGSSGAAGGGSGGSAAAGTGGVGAGGSAASGGAWVAPVGVPYPDFGVNETAEGCTACTMKQQSNLDGLANLAPGSVIELSGGPFVGGKLEISGDGTADKPIFVRGPSAGNRVVIQRETTIRGSYLIVENIDFDLSKLSSGMSIENADHVALRHSEVHGYDPGKFSTALYLGQSNDIVLLGNSVHDNGDFNFVGEQDVHGIGGGNIHRVWIVDNTLYKNRGDSAQFGHQAGNTSSDIFIGRNDIYGDGENCVDIKETSNVVVSENALHQTAFGAPLVVFHDCPVNAALIYNELYDTAVGVSMASLESACDGYRPVQQFVIRNAFKNVTDTAVSGWGSGKMHFVSGNTFSAVATPIDLSSVASGAVVAEDDTDLAKALAAFKTTYGIDITTP
ncbi:MAG TPA: right-handed parallel beta-helix repeat-containing protein [Polyangiaceae bacterium]|nr:right-handed parallel beta-helix repeat-containing protein [Polyangiaceae bacterium]